MARRPPELSPEARALVSQVSALQDQFMRARQEFAADLANVRAEVEKEVARIKPDLEQLRVQRARLDEELERLAADRSQLAEERDSLVAEAERKVNARRQRMAIELDKIRIQNKADAKAERQRNRDEVAAARAELDRDRAAFQVAAAGRRQELAELIGQAWDEYEHVRAGGQADALLFKDRPALKAAEAVRAKGRELAAARRAAKRAEWVVAFYEQQFPWLAELRDLEAEQDYVEGEPELTDDAAGDEHAATRDPAQQWLSKEEYTALSDGDRNQRALERYLASRQKPWQVGRDYERYIGYLREQAGARVSYQGIFAGLEDLGRDLICETQDGIEVVQCKRWARHKTIHEKHVFQLFGTVVAMRIEQPDETVTGTFTTTTTLSERAREFAAQLGIRVEENLPLADYPRIKCNVGRDGQRIYHLPFDQQYDTTLIEPEKGEHWVATVAEAEALGFRRAWQWKSAGTPAAT